MPPRSPRWPVTGAIAVVTSFALIAAAPMAADAAPNSSADGAVQMASRVTAVPVQAEAAAARKAPTTLRAATFNVRTSRADRGTRRHWLRRALSVAREIKSRNPGVVAVQELGPGRADGKKGKIKGALRQTESLEKALKSVGAKKYQVVRTTSYRKPGKTGGTQGVSSDVGIIYLPQRPIVLSLFLYYDAPDGRASTLIPDLGKLLAEDFPQP